SCYAPSETPIRDELKSARAFAETLGQPFWVVGGDVWLAAERYHSDGPKAALEDLEHALNGASALGIQLLMRYQEALLAHAYACEGRHEDAERLWAKIHTPKNRECNRMLWPELLRLRAEARRLAGAKDAEILGDLDQAEKMARQQGALAWLAQIYGTRRRLQLSPADTSRDKLKKLVSNGGKQHPAIIAAMADS
ncbi:MAG: hypothetical protein AB3N17_09470, partial [Tateyamaria sp.]